MTVLVISPDYASHLLPLATIATAWQRAGERVVVATGPANAALVDDFGYQRVDLRLGRGSNPGIIKVDEQPVGEDDNLRRFFQATRLGMIETLRYQADARRADLLWNPVASAQRVIEIVEAVHPDQILVDHLAFGATLGLNAAGIPYSDVVLGHPTALPVGDEVYGSLADWPTCFSPMIEELAELRRRCQFVSDCFTDDWNQAARQISAHTAEVDSAFAVHGQQVLFNYPTELVDDLRRATASEQVGSCTYLGASVRSDEVPPDVAHWLERVGRRPVVYVSFGSFLSARSDVLASVAAALSGIDVDVMLATGSADVADLGYLPDRWLARPYLPQVACLAHTDVAVTHGGNNTVTECLHHGVPMVVLPFSTDQFAGAAAVEHHGCGIALDPNASSPGALGAGITRVLSGDYGNIASALGARLRDAPGPDTAFAAIAQS